MKKIGTKLILYISILLLLFGTVLGVMVIRDVKSSISAVVTEKVMSDLNSSFEIINLMYPGQWTVENGSLYKGGTRINDNTMLVDKIGEMTGYTVTMFLGDTRIATNIEIDGERAVGTQAATNVIEAVIDKGEEFIGEADVLGARYQTVYRPIKEKNGNTIGMVFIGAPKAFEEGIVNRFIKGFLLVLIIALLIAIAAAAVIGRSIAKPINNITRLAEKVAYLDISRDASNETVNRKDEIGLLAKSFQAVIDSLRDIVHQVKAISQQVVASSEELAAISEESAAVSQQIALSAGGVAGSIKNQMNEIQKTASSIDEINVSIEEVSDNTKTIEAMSKEVFIKSNIGKEKIQTASLQMDNISKGTKAVQRSLLDITDSSNKMNSIIQVIDNIAEQTNLLALNASIEAARAGDHGRGFAVVAEEVRKLAEGSQEAVKQISSLITENHINIQNANNLMNKSAANVKEGTEVVVVAETTFLEISELIGSVNNQIQAITTTINHVAENSEEVVKSAKAIENISQNVSAEIDNVSASTEEQTASVEEVASSSQGLTLLAENLEKIIEKFNL
ncbi:methyl-accepting chemotaxis protein [Anaerovirgula multivorans]|uniref:Methyl-accepting chemotaxis protein n=1 Tax=Anaerovirgula multivorans TaxID=312168 RepID=A0A239BRM7_9FIRM|nr:methyl-accepting chemotaxis protein [Anaerovirgula multivorans]SNS09694.1 methyl-accepting chemotaxis protein [Anaerovirgula multivorans]